MHRVVSADAPLRQWDHYPPDDAVCAISGARYFYHLHPEGDRDPGEHGHFHLFLPGAIVGGPGHRSDTADPIAFGYHDLVHLVAISIDAVGLPCGLFTVNQWVTGDAPVDAATIARKLHRFSLTAAPGDPLVNAWLTALVQLCAEDIVALLHARDRAIAAQGIAGDDRSFEILSAMPLDIQALVDRYH